jgi:hypothetical protein
VHIIPPEKQKISPKKVKIFLRYLGHLTPTRPQPGSYLLEVYIERGGTVHILPLSVQKRYWGNTK